MVGAWLGSHSVQAGDWDDETAITQDPALQFFSFFTIDPMDRAYAMWLDWEDFEDTQVTLVRSDDRGQTWTRQSVIFDGAAYDNAKLVADDAGLHLLLLDFTEDEENEFKRPYYTRSEDGGKTFNRPVRVGERNNIEYTNLFTDDGMLYLQAMNIIFGEAGDEFQYFFYVSADGGETWIEKPILPGWSISNPDFAVRDGVIHMAFGGGFGGSGMDYSYSADQGDNWSSPVAIATKLGDHPQLPQIEVDDNAIHVAWEDDRTGVYNIRYASSTDGGQTFSVDQQLNKTPYGARNKLLVTDDGLHIVCCQYHGDDGWPDSWSSGDYGILWHRFSDDSGATWSDEFRVSQNDDIPPIDLPDNGANYVKLAPYSDGFGAMWQDKRDGNYDLYLRNNIIAGAPCSWDLDGDGNVGTGDLIVLLGSWGDPYGTQDLIELLGAWGACP